MPEQIVKNMKELRAMEKAGFIKILPETGKTVRWNYGETTSWYIDEGQYMFQWDKDGDYKTPHAKDVSRTFKTKFFDGCFYPFVVEIL